MEASRHLSNLQVELLQLFRFELDNVQLQEIKALLAAYFAQKATEEMDALFEEKGWGDEKIDEWSQEHMRTKYKDQ
jgi:hypothetical protein